MTPSLEHRSSFSFNPGLTRRHCIRILFWSGLCLALPCSSGLAAAQAEPVGILERFLGEQLSYQIGFWLFHHCGEARTRFFETERPGIYRASLEGRTVGLIDVLLGRYRYACVSFMEVSTDGNRLRPLRFQLTKRRRGQETRRTVHFDHANRKLLFSETGKNGKTEHERLPMREGILYEDYLTLFYNFRYGRYGPLERGCTYRLPLHVHKGMNSLDLAIAPREEEEKRRREESNKQGKDFVLRFRVNREDVSSKSGEIEGWLSFDAVPVKGTIKDVILFGDLWGELIQRRVSTPRHVAAEDAVRMPGHFSQK